MPLPLVEIPYSGLHTIISGGQTGADQAGLFCAKQFNITTGGHIARGFRTILGPQPFLGETFGLIEHSSRAYQPRTKANATLSDGTVRLASNFNTAGEVLTLRYVNEARKPCLSLLLDGNSYESKAEELVNFLINHSIGCLNVAGNADKDTHFGYHFDHASEILTHALNILSTFNLIIHADNSTNTPAGHGGTGA